MKHEFKKGDWVTKLDGFSSSGGIGNSSYGGAGFDFVEPKTFQIERVSENTKDTNALGNQVIWYKNNGIFSVAVRPALFHEIPTNKQQEIDIQIGDTFINSVGNAVEIYDKDFYTCYLKSSSGKRYTLSRKSVLVYIQNGTYMCYKPVSQQKSIKQWKKEDFYDTKIVLNDPEKSRKLQEYLFTLGIKWNGKGSTVDYVDKYSISITENGILKYGSKFGWNSINRKELSYDDIFNENSNQLNNNKNDKETSSIESKGSNDPIERGDSRERSSLSIGGRGEGLNTGNRKVKNRSVKIGEGTRSKGKGLCIRRRTPRSVTI